MTMDSREEGDYQNTVKDVGSDAQTHNRRIEHEIGGTIGGVLPQQAQMSMTAKELPVYRPKLPE